MNDLISRQAAIDALRTCYDTETVTMDDGDEYINYGDAIGEIEQLPSAQPETHEERTETHACDCISRRAAIDAHYEYCNKHPDAGFPVWSLKILEDLPSAQPENIQCKDCKHHGTNGYRLNCAMFCCTMPDDGFCSCGERREDG